MGRNIVAQDCVPFARDGSAVLSEDGIACPQEYCRSRLCIFRQGWQRRPVGEWHCMSTGILSLKIVSLLPGMAAPSCWRVALHVHRNIVAQDCVSFARDGSAVLSEVAMRHVAYLHMCLFRQGWQRRPVGGWHCMSTGVLSLEIVSLLPEMA